MPFFRTSEQATKGPPSVDWNDVQALVRSNFRDLKASAFVSFRFPDARNQEISNWLSALVTRISRCEKPAITRQAIAARSRALRSTQAVNIVFSAQGIQRLLAGKTLPPSFSQAFREGMSPHPSSADAKPRRSAYLGDTGTNDPTHWRWRDSDDGDARIDGMLLLYAIDDAALYDLLAKERQMMQENGILLAKHATSAQPVILSGKLLESAYEPFGFKDGLSQPILDSDRRDLREIEDQNQHSELAKRAVEQSVIRTGEVLLGYRNERGAVAGQIGAEFDARLKNGTYVVIRELHQDVTAFENYVRSAADAHFQRATQQQIDWIKERLIGRRQEGEMMTATNDVPSSTTASRNESLPSTTTLGNDVLYHPSDRFGLACPLGSHVRRANPRDSLAPDPGTAMRLGKMHRLVRRGRLIDKGPSPGLYFVALNADISGQFEHVQQNWINNDRFLGLNGEIDPISHFRPNEHTQMTIQRRPFNIRLKNIPQFVTVRGGGYFFLPGLTGLGQLAAAVLDT